MAKVRSPVYAQALGSVGGATYSKAPGVAITLRQRFASVQPSTDRQRQSRQAFTRSCALWTSLTPSQRAGWARYAAGTSDLSRSTSDLAGGRMIFINVVSKLLYLRAHDRPLLKLLLEPPLRNDIYQITPIRFTPLPAPGTGFRMFFSHLSGPRLSYLFQLTGPFSPTRLSQPPFHRSISEIYGELVSPITSFWNVTGLSIGQRYWIWLTAVGGSSGLTWKHYQVRPWSASVIASETI